MAKRDANGDIVLPGGGGAGITDGDKGDVTVSGSGATWTIDPGAVTLAKMANMNTAKLLGRSTAGSGAPEEITVGSGLSLASGTLSATGGGGGGGGGGSGNKHPDNPPVAPTSQDDEFNESTLNTTTKWTWRNQGSATATLSQGALRLKGASTNHAPVVRGLQIIEQTVSGDFRYRAKLSLVGGVVFNNGGLVLVENGTGKVVRYGLIRGQLGAGTIALAVEVYSNATTYFSTPYQSGSFASQAPFTDTPWKYLEIERIGGTLYFRASETGEDDSFSLLYSVAQTSLVTTAPDRVGLYVESISATQAVLICEWFRKIEVGYDVQLSGGAATGATNDGASIHRNATPQTLTTGIHTVVTFDTESRDDGSYANLGANNDRITITNAGWYDLKGTVRFASNASGSRSAYFRINGTTTDRYGQQSVAAAPGGLDTILTAVASLYLNAGDYVQLAAWQDSGGNLSLPVTTTQQPRLSVHRQTGGGSSGSSGINGARTLFETDFLMSADLFSTSPGVGNFNYFQNAGGLLQLSSVISSAHPGVMRLANGGGVGGVVVVGMTPNVFDTSGSIYVLDSDDLVLDYIMRVDDITSTNRYWFVGMNNDTDLFSHHFRFYLRAGTMVIESTNGGAAAFTVCSPQPPVNTFFHLQLRASSASIRALINGVLACTHTTNIPTQGMFPNFQCGGNPAGAVNLDIDFFRISKTFSVNRAPTLL